MALYSLYVVFAAILFSFNHEAIAYAKSNTKILQQAKKIETLKLDKTQTEKINTLLSHADKLRVSLRTQDEDQIEISIYEINHSVSDIIKSLNTNQNLQASQLYLLKGLNKIKEILLKINSTHDQNIYIELFNQFSGLVHSFKLDSKFIIHFCNKDNISWIEDRFSTIHGLKLNNHEVSCNIEIRK